MGEPLRVGRVTSPPAQQFESQRDSRGRPVPVREHVAAGGAADLEEALTQLSHDFDEARAARDKYERLYRDAQADLRREQDKHVNGGPTPQVQEVRSHVPRGREFETHETGASGNRFTTTQDFQVLSWEPHAVLYRNFASLEECERVKELASRRLSPSGLALRRGESAKSTGDIRTSSGTFLSRNEDPKGVVERLERRIADVTHVHYTHGEPFNVLRYQNGQKYDSHYDTFDPESYGPQVSQRIASFLLYLTDVEAGGETHFPLEGPGGLGRLKNINYKSCDHGLHVKPRVGTGVTWRCPLCTFFSSHLGKVVSAVSVKIDFPTSD